jgi:hypothetical protein
MPLLQLSVLCPCPSGFEGVVTDAETGEPIAGAEVYVEGIGQYIPTTEEIMLSGSDQVNKR